MSSSIPKQLATAKKRAQTEEVIRENLPHLYGFPFYSWAQEFYDSRNKMNLLVAANQISKSSTQIRKCIHWATSPDLWPGLWRTTPRQFWYLYPSKEVCTTEWETKWIPEFMPRGPFKKHPIFGWTRKYLNKQVHEIIFNSGVRIYFKSYAQDVQKLQASTAHCIFCDEELPEDIFDELMFRLAASDGYYHQVFTATLGQQLWFDALEKIGTKDETFKDAWKKRVSMYDCLEYADGSPTPWTEARIEKIKATCGTENEIKRRIYGRFVLDSGLKYPSFRSDTNVCTLETFKKRNNITKTDKEVPDNWLIYSGVDIGSGGKTGHPAAIIFVAVKPDYTQGVVFRGWRGDKSSTTTASDILDKYRMLRGGLRTVLQCYDWASRDFFSYASRLGEAFTKADKSKDLGEDTLNTLFKNKMLDIIDCDELEGLVLELRMLTKAVNKNNARDDFIDALRYSVTMIPWNWTAVTYEFGDDKAPTKKKPPTETELRRSAFMGLMGGQEEVEDIEDEINYYNELY